MLDGNEQDLEKLAARLRERHRQKMLEKQEQMRKQWGMPPTPGQTNQTQNQLQVIYINLAPGCNDSDDG